MKKDVPKSKTELQTPEEEKNELASAHIKRTSIEQYNKEIEEAEKQINSGRFKTHEEVVAALKQLMRH